MTKVFGESGRNAAEESHKRTRGFLLVGLVGIALLSLISGFAIGGGFAIARLRWQVAVSIALSAACLFWFLAFLLYRWTSKKMDALDRERMSWRKGALGESHTAETLKSLPDGYVLINDVTKKLGNIDHVVIGPTGVYVIDVKNWNGTIKADGEGELLWNGRAPGKPAIRNMLRAVMDFQNKIKALTENEYFVRGLIVFPIAYVDADFGSTRQIHCLRNERLVDYIQNKKFAQTLNRNDIDQVTRATLQLAGMDKRFATI
jgi:nuclease-like protein